MLKPGLEAWIGRKGRRETENAQTRNQTLLKHKSKNNARAIIKTLKAADQNLT